MDIATHNRLDARAKVLKALAHPSRLFIIEELAKGERCVCELTDLIGADTSTISKHLSLMKNAGLILDDKRGLKVYYRLRTACVLNFLDCVEAVLHASLNEQIAAVRCTSERDCSPPAPGR
ncbi:MAG: winged helix-turn-helix transcriptional regulator [Kiritimatiellaeota bacterium]|nr:winged helix-turn-helix transcriptional regulator [Kiritimatiellota bacterium]